MGLVQKIFYFHVPSAWLFLVSAIDLRRRQRAIFLFGRGRRADRVAVAAAELAVVFGASGS